MYEDGVPLGPAHTHHDSISRWGMGRFSYWSGILVFSSSDNSDPRINGRRYHFRAVARLGYPWLLVAGLAMAGAVGLAWPVLVALGSGAFRALAPLKIPAIVAFNTLIVVGIVLGGAEVVFRLSKPFKDTAWPSRHVPEVGFTFQPGAEVRWTNYLDYWTVSRANSLGFLDNEPLPPQFDGCRVAIVGDSFVQGAEVSIDERFQNRLRALADKLHPDWRLSTAAFGYSGTGQINQLAFYDQFLAPSPPDWLVLVFVVNDFSNNSAVLEAVRNGWHPRHPPLLYAVRTSSGFDFVPISPDWQAHLLPVATAPTGNCVACEVHRYLTEVSIFYRWLVGKLRVLAPGSVGFLKLPQPGELERLRRDWLIQQDIPGAQGLMSRSGSPGLDAMFYERELPRAFADALLFTGFALDEFVRRARRDGVEVVVLATSQMSAGASDNDEGYGLRALRRLEDLARERGLIVLDQGAWLRSHGLPPTALQFRHDGHWNPLGHEIAAVMTLEYLEENPGGCSARAHPW